MRDPIAYPRRPTPKEIRPIFPNAMATGIILPELHKGLMVVFNKQADLCRELGIEQPSGKIAHAELFDLVRQFEFVVLKNCSALTIPDQELSRLSKGADHDGHFIQDPYHYDVPPLQNHLNLPSLDFMSGICKKSAEGRKAKTYCAPEEEVKQAIRLLDISELPLEVVEALDQMSSPDYHFRLYHPAENDARQIVKTQYPGFVEDVFALIPEGRKYAQSWLKNQWDILLIANVFGNWVHARPTGECLASHEIAANPLQGLYLYR